MCRTATPEEAAAASAKNGRAVSLVLDKANQDLREIERQELQAANERSALLGSWSRWLVVLSIFLAAAVSVIVLMVVRGVDRQLRQAIQELKQGAGEVANAAAQVSSSSQSLAQGASQSAASIEETSASTEEINSMARRNNEELRAAAGQHFAGRSGRSFRLTSR